MPSTRPSAAFEPISPDFDVKTLVETTPNFEWVVRIHCDMIDHQGLDNFEKLVLIHVILGGKPLVIEGYHERLDRWTYALQWLRDNCASKVETARDLTKKSNVPLSIGHYLNHMALLTNQWSNKNYKDPERQRMYLKDIDCPQLWHDKLRDLVPAGLFYLNETTGDLGGLGAIDEVDPSGPGMRKGRGVAKAGDLMSSLPKEMRAENMMCYIGHEGTYTPAHREMCASLGQNIMVETSTGATEDGKPTKPGSSIWFMTEMKEREVVSEYWLSKLGHDIEVENHFAQINAWKAAPFKTYVVEQHVGDFILIPPLAPHQVWNRGTRTMKVAWNRTTVETLEMALTEALPRARMVCRDEQYKNKAIIYYTLQKYSKALKVAERARQKKQVTKHKDTDDIKIRQVQKDFRRLQALFTQLLLSESFLSHQAEKKIELVPFDSNITCSYCRCNIFNKFLTCPSCVGQLPDGSEDTYDICMECYAMGRSCACISKLKWVEQFPWGDLVQKHEQWRHQILQSEGKVTDKSPKSLKTELERLGKKRTLAQICQLELIKRPFRDITKPALSVGGLNREEITEVDDNGNVKKKKKVRRSEKFTREHARCHVDMHWEPKWKQAQCSTCDKNYCYGVLFRAYDMMPQDILADPTWKCPSCRNICSCRHCRIKPSYQPFTPSGTILGHNTKLVADPRSVESLVDFSFSNMSWIQKAGDDHTDNSRRLTKRKKAAEKAMAQDPENGLGDDYAETDGVNDGIEDNLLRLAEHEGIPIDPALAAIGLPSEEQDSQEDEDEFDENPEGARRKAGVTAVAPLAPQFVVPDGGVVRDSEHAYEPTDAITYDYPDPEAGVPIPIPEEQSQPPQGTYEPVIPASPSPIEMIDRKRKREKVDEGDRPYGSTKQKKQISEKPQPRRSLIVKLGIKKEKLVEMNRMAIIAQRALSGVAEVPAPVISSDLRALNAEWNGLEAQPPASKKPRVEQIVIDEDDDFTPSRYRDRRRAAPDELHRPPPDADITRRTTRMQAVTYEVPSDEEEDFNEVQAPRPARSKLATMERKDVPSASHSDAESEDLPDAISGTVSRINQTAYSTNDHVAKHPKPTAKSCDNASDAAIGGVLDSVLSQPAPKSHFAAKRIHSSEVVDPKACRVRPVTQQNPSNKARGPSNAIAEAQANRKAKLAALEWAEGDSDSFDTDGSSEDERGTLPQKKLHQQARPFKQRPSMSSVERPTPPVVRERSVISGSTQKVSAADWGDDSSDDGKSGSRRATGGPQPAITWAAVNHQRASGLKPISSGGGRSR